jgi:hypothetical protein
MVRDVGADGPREQVGRSARFIADSPHCQAGRSATSARTVRGSRSDGPRGSSRTVRTARPDGPPGAVCSAACFDSFLPFLVLPRVLQGIVPRARG